MDVRPTDIGGLPPATACAGTAHDTSGGGAATPAGALGSDAARGALLASPDARLTDAIGRLSVAVRDLKVAVDAWIARMNGGGAVGGGGPAAAAPMKQSSAGSPVQGGGAAPTTATARTSAIPDLAPGSSEQLRLARSQVTYREVPVSGGAAGTTFTPPAAPPGIAVEVYALRDYQRGAHRTQVLEPVTGPVTVAPGDNARFIVRLRGDAPGSYAVDVGGARIDVTVGSTAVEALPMMAWINERNATARGADGSTLGSVLAHFGVAATGNSGIATTSASNRSPVQYFSAAYEAATRQSPAETARRIVEAEQRAGSANPGAAFWVQVSDEQDKDAASAQRTTQWIAELRQHLVAQGSRAKLFVAAQARPHNLVYASVIDGWATTQSAAGRDRDTAIADIRRAAAGSGRNIELMEYPGNAFFDAGTPGSAAVSTASAALDGASSWFVYSANNLDVLERGGGDEGRGDIGGLVVVDGGRVLPTIALIEAELGANLGAAARAFGATGTSGAQQVAWTSDQLDAYRHTGQAPDLRLWETQIGAYVR
jgi:hypothetical protein